MSYAAPYKPSIWRRLHLTDQYGLTVGGFLGLLAGGGLVVTAVIIGLVVGLSRPYGRTTCRNWGQQTGYPTKYRVLNWLDTGTCFARTPSGRWVLNAKVQVFDGTLKRGR